MFNYASIKRIVGHVIFYDHCWLVKSQSHTKLEHNIWVFSTDIANDDIRIIDILDDTFLNYADIVRITHKIDVDTRLTYVFNCLRYYVFNLSPMFGCTTV